MIVNYNSKKNNGKIGVPSLYGFEGNHIKAIHYEGEGDDNFYNEHVRSAI
jgi:hypothetical protein